MIEILHDPGSRPLLEGGVTKGSRPYTSLIYLAHVALGHPFVGLL